MNLRCFKLYRVYFTSFNPTNVGDFFWGWILKDYIKVQEEKKKIVVLCSRLPQNVKLGTVLSSRSRATTAKECTNKRDAHAKLLFCLSKPFEVSRSRCRRRRPARCLSSLKNPDTETVLFGNRFPGERSQIGIKICVLKNAWTCVDIASVLI